MRSAVVIADGRSIPFGTRSDGPDDTESDASRGDGPPIRRVVERIEPAVGEVVVNCPAERREDVAAALEGVDYREAVHSVPDGGPVAGIRTGCRVARGRWTFVTAPDVPFVRAEFATRLFDAAAEDGRDAAVPRIDDRLRPLAAVYRTDSAIEAADTTLGLGTGSVTHLLDRLAVATVTDPAPVQPLDDVDARIDSGPIPSRST